MNGATIWLVTGWLFAAAGVAAVAVGLWWDRAKGRRRCPTCWYDMQGAAGMGAAVGGDIAALKCPECGRGVKNVRSLLRTRRRWRWVVVGTLLLMAAYPATQEPLLRAGKWQEAVPTWVIVYCWPLDFEAWEKSCSEPMMDELVQNRLDDPTRNVWAARAFVREWQSSTAQRVHANASGVEKRIRVFDCTPYWKVLQRDTTARKKGAADCNWGGGGGSSGPCFGRGSVKGYSDDAKLFRDSMVDLSDLATINVRPDDWAENGGAEGRVRAIGPYLVMHAPQSMGDDAATLLQRFATFVRSMQADADQPPVLLIEDNGRVVRAYAVGGLIQPPTSGLDGEDAYRKQQQLLYEFDDVMWQRIEPDSWRENGGDEGWCWHGGTPDVIVISHRPEVHAQVEVFLHSLEGTSWRERALPDSGHP